MERRPRGIIINPKADEKASAPTLYDATDRPISEDASVPIIHTPAQDKAGKVVALVPGLVDAKRKFADSGIEMSGNEDGLTLATRKTRKLELVSVDTAPEELRGSEPIITEYYDFPPELIASVLEAHKSGKINLYSGDKKQFAVYVTKVMHASGLRPESDAYKLIQASLGKSTDEDGSIKDLVSGRLPRHPYARRVKKTKGGHTWDTKIYEDCVPYDNLSLVLLPEIWISMDSAQKGQLIKSLLLLHETTTNFKEIDAARLHERLAEICANEKEMPLRYNIYAILDAVPSESLTTVAKNNLAGAIMRNHDFGTDLAFSLLRESEEISLKKPPVDIGASGLEKLWPMYKKYEQGVLDKLSQPLVDLAMTDDMEWVKLLDSVTRLSPYALIDSSEPKKDDAPIGHFGLELEFAPLHREAYITVQKFNEALGHDEDYDLLPLLTSIDNDCAEVRTDIGGEQLDANTLHRLQVMLRSLQHAEPLGWWATMHVHIDDDTCSSERINDVYAESRIFTNHNTHEIRSFSSPNFYAEGPTQGLELNRVSITKLAHLLKLGLHSRDIPNRREKNNGMPEFVNGGSLNADARLRKLLAISLCGNDPRQRVAALYASHTAPMFLSNSHILDVIVEAGDDYKAELLKAGLDILPSERIYGFINDLIENASSSDLLKAEELYNLAEDTEIKDYIFQSIARYGKKNSLPFLLNHYSEIKRERAKLAAIPIFVQYGNEAGHDIIKKLYEEAQNDRDRYNIIDTVAVNGGVVLLREWYKDAGSLYGGLVRKRIIQRLTEHGGVIALPFLMEQYLEINNQNSRDAILFAVAEHSGSEGIPFIDRHYHEVSVETREDIIEVIVKNSDEAGMKAVKKWYDEEEDSVTKSNILQTVLENKGAYAVYELTGDEKWLP